MRTLIITAWILLLPAVAAYHFGPGKKDMLLDDIGRQLKLAEALVVAGENRDAIDAYEKALSMMPDGKLDQQRRIRLEIAKLQMTSQGLPDAYLGLTSLVEELRDDPKADPNLTRQAEAALANSQYYLTWLLRLEGAPMDVWEPVIESARQTFRELAETTDADKQYSEDLEATIRLARMDLNELQGLSLPCQCKGCCSSKCNCQGKKKCNKKGKGPGKKKTKDARGASSGPPPDGSGS